MFCSQCGAPSDAAAAACLQCGFNFQAPARPSLNTERAVAASKNALHALKLLLRDPVGSIGAAHESLQTKALDVGIAFCVLFILSWIVAIRMIGRLAARTSFGIFGFSLGFKEVLQIALVAVVPIVSIVAIFFVLQMLAAKRNDLPRALFAGGAVLLPMAIFNVAGGILGAGNAEVLALVALFALCYTILLIYAACRDVLGIPSAWAAASVPVILLATAWLTKIILAAVL
ncbi:MAG TPA: hypothetical protein VFO89_05360 [Thermoanaerobaculia bacterium]|nr:hypothetical protein [Thermoanaerobaculia bacterium]